MENQEEFINEEEIITKQKIKKPPSQAQLEHLRRIREKALIKKKEMKELTEKARLQLELESNKLSKKLEKEELARRYEQHLKTSKEQSPKGIIEVTFEDGKKIEEVKNIEESQPKKDNPKTKKKIIKKIVYEEESDNDESSVEEVIVKRTKSKIKQLQQEMKPIQPSKFYSELVNESSLDKLRQKMMDERCRSLLSSVTPDYR